MAYAPSTVLHRVLRSRASILLAMLLAGSTVNCRAQQNAVAAGSSGEQLQQAIAQQQDALSSGNTGTILSTSRHLAALALLLTGRLRRAEDKDTQAAEAFSQSLQAEPLAPTYAELITTDLLAGRPAEARQAEDATIAALGDVLETRLLLAEACFSGDDLSCTVAQLQQALRLQPGSAAAHLALGGAYWAMNEYQYNAGALEQFAAAQKLDPAGFAANYELGAVLSQYQRYAEASVPLRLAAQADSTSPDPWMQLGMNAFAQGNYAAAQPLLTRAVDLTGSDLSRNQYQVRRAFAALSRIASAANRTSAAADYDARDQSVRTAMAQAGAVPQLSQSTGLVTNSTAQGNADARPAQAVAADAQILQSLSQIAAQSLNDAGTALAQIRDYEGALPLFRLAAQANAQLAPVLRNLALAAYHTNRMDEAAKALRAWLEQHPDDATAQRYLQQITGAAPRPTTPQ